MIDRERFIRPEVHSHVWFGNARRRLLTVLGATVLTRAMRPALATMLQSGGAKTFRLGQAMRYARPLDLLEFGIERCDILYESALVNSDAADGLLPDLKLSGAVSSLTKRSFPAVIDIERWPLYVSDDGLRGNNVNKLLRVLQKLRRARPDLLYGFYGVAPQRVAWAFDGDPRELAAQQEWHRLNELARQDFVPYVDAIFPSLYTLHDGFDVWRMNAEAIVGAALNFGKPVYCFLWPQYHPANKRHAGQYLTGDYWRAQLEFCYTKTDGAIIWNYDIDRPWDPVASWWLETLAFLRAHTDVPQPRH